MSLYHCVVLSFQDSISHTSSENDEGPVAKLAKYTDGFVSEKFSTKHQSFQPKRKSNGKTVANKSDVSVARIDWSVREWIEVPYIYGWLTVGTRACFFFF